MLLGMLLKFIFETGCLGMLVWLGWVRLASHLKDNPEGVAALTTHLFEPLLGKKSNQRTE